MMEAVTMRTIGFVVAALTLMAMPVSAQDSCPNRGQLDVAYCDADGNLVADPPSDPAKWRDPSTLIWAFTPVEDPSIYANIFKPLNEYLAQCTGKKIAYHPVNSNSAQIEAMRSGRLHFAAFSSGQTGFAVNLAGAVPFAAHGLESGLSGYTLLAVVKTSSPFQSMADLKGRRVAHTAPSSNSGHLAPMVLFPAQGLNPGVDYKPLMSGGHDKSIIGVTNGDYDMGAIASNVYERMLQRGAVKAADLRVLYKSPIFPPGAYSHAHDLKPELAKTLVSCFHAFRMPPEMRKEFNDSDRYYPVTYKTDWAVVREVAEKSGTPYNKAAYEAEKIREAEAAAKKAAQPGATKP
jgi:phosphonate transport system substrate-binding protein